MTSVLHARCHSAFRRQEASDGDVTHCLYGLFSPTSTKGQVWPVAASAKFSSLRSPRARNQPKRLSPPVANALSFYHAIWWYILYKTYKK